MFTLFLDTHDKNIIEVLFKNDKVFDKEIRLSEKQHSDYTIPMLKTLLERNKMTVHDLNSIIIVNGPGSFTGVRLGVTIAKTLAYTLEIPIKTISSLEAIALSDHKHERKLPIIRDVKGVFCQLYDNENISEIAYYSNANFLEYKKKNKIEDDEILENVEYDFESILKYMEDKPTIKAHEVNPLYIKVIEALKND